MTVLSFIVETPGGVFIQEAAPRTRHVELIGNRISFAQLTFDDDDRVLEHLRTANIRILWNGVYAMRGPVRIRKGSRASRSVTVEVWDDFYQFNLLGWQKPTAAVTAQSDEYRRYSDDLETATKLACSELSTRLGLGWSVVPTTGLGDNVRVELRMHSLAEKFTPLLDVQKLFWTLEDGVVDVREGELFARTLTEESGVIQDYEWEWIRPTVTRVVVGGAGEGTARVFRQYIDAALEAEFGFIGEAFKDSRMAAGITDLSPDADEVLAEGAERVSLTAQIAETSWFRFGDTYQLGDRVNVSLPGVEMTNEVISKVVIDDTPSKGLTVTPTVGLIDSSAEARQVQMIAALARGVRDAGRR